VKVEFRGKKLKGLWTFKRDDPRINLWTFAKEVEAPPVKSVAPTGVHPSK